MNSSNLMDISQSVDVDFDIPFAKRQESLINNRFQSDVTFLVGEKRQPIYAHKLLLIISSEHFNGMFNGKESNSEEIEVNDVEPDIFLEILRYIYCRKVHLTVQNVLEIFVHAQKYMLDELRQQSIGFFEKNVASDNVLKLFAQNRLYEFSIVNEKCLSLILKNPLLFFKHEDFYALDRKSLDIIFSSKKFNCSDTQLLQALRDWNKVNESECVSDLQTMINTKRVRNCSKLRFFGSLSYGTHTDFEFSLNRSHKMTLYGIGVFVGSNAEMITIEVKIRDNSKTLASHQFELENKDRSTVDVAKLFFEELKLLPSEKYTITIGFNPSEKRYTISNPASAHKTVSLQIFNQNGNNTYGNSYTSTTGSVISHFYYDVYR
ncbi:BTB/POZ domain-containing protein 3-like [Aedes albopictus]|uniref:BTB domain-containing protein n=1 Tax=Aedes albopictus TaxID=7160 RepID=A0ABM1YZL8_AEDAL